MQDMALEAFNFDKNVFGLDFLFKHGENSLNDNYHNKYYDICFVDSFLNILDKKFEDLEYVRIHSHLLTSLIICKKYKFFDNNFKYFEIYNENEPCFLDFIEIFDKIKSVLKTEELKINFLAEKAKDIDKIYLTNIKIKKLELSGICNIKSHDSYCVLNEETTKHLENLTIDKSSIYFKNIIFPNLVSLNISGTYFKNIFRKNSLFNNTFPKLSHLTLEIISRKDYYYITKLLEYSKLTLIELNLSLNFDFYIKKEEKYENEENNDEYEKLSNSIIDLKYLKYLRINNFFSFNCFIDIILINYRNNNLIEFQSNCIKLIDAKTFINNNKNLKIINLL